MTGARRALFLPVALLAGLALSVGVTACGTQQISADEVTVNPPDISVPTGPAGGDALAGDTPTRSTTTDTTDTTGETTTDGTSGSGSSASSSAGSASSSGSTATGGSAAPSATAAPSGSSGGASAPAQPQQDSAANDTAPAPGSGADKFEEFCQQNAGAC